MNKKRRGAITLSKKNRNNLKTLRNMVSAAAKPPRHPGIPVAARGRASRGAAARPPLPPSVEYNNDGEEYPNYNAEIQGKKLRSHE